MELESRMYNSFVVEIATHLAHLDRFFVAYILTRQKLEVIV